MSGSFRPYLGSSSIVVATASNVQGTITMPDGADGLMIVNTSTTVWVAYAYGSSAQTAVLATHPPLAPTQGIVVEANNKIGHIAAIGSAAGPTTVSFTPCKLNQG